MAATELASYEVSFKAKIEGYESQIENIKKQLAAIGKDTKLGKGISKQLDSVIKDVDKLSQHMNMRFTSDSQIMRTFDNLNNIDKTILQIGEDLQKVDIKDLDVSKLDAQMKGLVQEFQALQQQLESNMSGGFDKVIEGWMGNANGKFRGLMERLKIDPKDLNYENFSEVFTNAMQESTKAAEEFGRQLDELKAKQAEAYKAAGDNFQKSNFKVDAKKYQLDLPTGDITTIAKAKVQELQDKLNEFLSTIKVPENVLSDKIKPLIESLGSAENLGQLELALGNFEKAFAKALDTNIGKLESSFQSNMHLDLKSLLNFDDFKSVDTSALENIRQAISNIFAEKDNLGKDANALKILIDNIINAFQANDPSAGVKLYTEALTTYRTECLAAAKDSRELAKALQEQINITTEARNQTKADVAMLNGYKSQGQGQIQKLQEENKILRQQLAEKDQTIRNYASGVLSGTKESGGKISLEARTQLEANARAASEYTQQLHAVQEAEKMVGKIEGVVQRWFSVYAVVRMVSQAINSIKTTLKDLDKTITEIAIVTKMSQSDLWGQMGTYTQLAQQYAASISGVYQVSQLYYQQGLQTADVMALTESTLKMARISGLDYAEATDYMTNAVRSFKMEMEDAEVVVDVYSAIAAKSATNVKELAIAMSKTASSAESVGSSFQNTTAMMAVMIESTREAAQNIGSAMKSIISRYGEMKADPTKLIDSEGEALSLNKVDTALQSVGITLHNAKGEFRDFDDVIEELAKSWDTIDINTQRYIATVMAGNRQQSRFLALVSNYDRYKELSEEAANAENASQLQFLKTLDSIEAKSQQLETSIQSLYTSSGLENFYKGILDISNAVIKSLTNMPTAFNLPIAALTKFATTFYSLASIIKNVFALIVNELTIAKIQYNAAAEEEVKNYVNAKEREVQAERDAQQAMNQAALDGANTRSGIAAGETENVISHKDAKARAASGGQLRTASLARVGLNLGALGLSAVASNLKNSKDTGYQIAGGYASIGSSALSGAAMGSIAGPWGGVIGAIAGAAVGALQNWKIIAQDIDTRLANAKQSAQDANNKMLLEQNQTKSLQAQIEKIKELEKSQYDSVEAQQKYLEANQTLANEYPQLINKYAETGEAIIDLAAANSLLQSSLKKSIKATQDAALENFKLALAEKEKEEEPITGFLEREKYKAEGLYSSETQLASYLAYNVDLTDAQQDRLDRRGPGSLIDHQVLTELYNNYISLPLEELAKNPPKFDASKIHFNDAERAIYNYIQEQINTFNSIPSKRLANATRIQATARAGLTNSVNEYLNSVNLLEENNPLKDLINSNQLVTQMVINNSNIKDIDTEAKYKAVLDSSTRVTEEYRQQLITWFNSIDTEKYLDIMSLQGKVSSAELIKMLKDLGDIPPEILKAFQDSYKDTFNYTKAINNLDNQNIKESLDEFFTWTGQKLSDAERQAVLEYSKQISKLIEDGDITQQQGEQALQKYLAVWSSLGVAKISPEQREVAEEMLRTWDGTEEGLLKISDSLQGVEGATGVLTAIDGLINSLSSNLNTIFSQISSSISTSIKDIDDATKDLTKGVTIDKAIEYAEKLKLNFSDFVLDYSTGLWKINDSSLILDKQIQNIDDQIDAANNKLNEYTSNTNLIDYINSHKDQLKSVKDISAEDAEAIGLTPREIFALYTQFYSEASDVINQGFSKWLENKFGKEIAQLETASQNAQARAALSFGNINKFLNIILENELGLLSPDDLSTIADSIIRNGGVNKDELIAAGIDEPIVALLEQYGILITDTLKDVNSNILSIAFKAIKSGTQSIQINESNIGIVKQLQLAGANIEGEIANGKTVGINFSDSINYYQNVVSLISQLFPDPEQRDKALQELDAAVNGNKTIADILSEGIKSYKGFGSDVAVRFAEALGFSNTEDEQHNIITALDQAMGASGGEQYIKLEDGVYKLVDDVTNLKTKLAERLSVGAIPESEYNELMASIDEIDSKSVKLDAFEEVINNYKNIPHTLIQKLADNISGMNYQDIIDNYFDVDANGKITLTKDTTKLKDLQEKLGLAGNESAEEILVKLYDAWAEEAENGAQAAYDKAVSSINGRVQKITVNAENIKALQDITGKTLTEGQTIDLNLSELKTNAEEYYKTVSRILQGGITTQEQAFLDALQEAINNKDPFEAMNDVISNWNDMTMEQAIAFKEAFGLNSQQFGWLFESNGKAGHVKGKNGDFFKRVINSNKDLSQAEKDQGILDFDNANLRLFQQFGENADNISEKMVEDLLAQTTMTQEEIDNLIKNKDGKRTIDTAGLETIADKLGVTSSYAAQLIIEGKFDEAREYVESLGTNVANRGIESISKGPIKIAVNDDNRAMVTALGGIISKDGASATIDWRELKTNTELYQQKVNEIMAQYPANVSSQIISDLDNALNYNVRSEGYNTILSSWDNIDISQLDAFLEATGYTLEDLGIVFKDNAWQVENLNNFRKLIHDDEKLGIKDTNQLLAKADQTIKDNSDLSLLKEIGDNYGNISEELIGKLATRFKKSTDVIKQKYLTKDKDGNWTVSLANIEQIRTDLGLSADATAAEIIRAVFEAYQADLDSARADVYSKAAKSITTGKAQSVYVDDKNLDIMKQLTGNNELTAGMTVDLDLSTVKTSTAEFYRIIGELLKDGITEEEQALFDAVQSVSPEGKRQAAMQEVISSWDKVDAATVGRFADAFKLPKETIDAIFKADDLGNFIPNLELIGRLSNQLESSARDQVQFDLKNINLSTFKDIADNYQNISTEAISRYAILTGQKYEDALKDFTVTDNGIKATANQISIAQTKLGLQINQSASEMSLNIYNAYQEAAANSEKNVYDTITKSMTEGVQRIIVDEYNAELLSAITGIEGLTKGQRVSINWSDITKDSDKYRRLMAQMAIDGFSDIERSTLTTIENYLNKDNPVQLVNNLISSWQNVDEVSKRIFVDAFKLDDETVTNLFSYDRLTNSYKVNLELLRAMIADKTINLENEGTKAVSEIDSTLKEYKGMNIFSQIAGNMEDVSEQLVYKLADTLGKEWDYDKVLSTFFEKDAETGRISINFTKLQELRNSLELATSENAEKIITQIVDSYLEQLSSFGTIQSSGYTKLEDMQELKKEIGSTKDLSTLFTWNEELSAYVLSTQGIIEYATYLKNQLGTAGTDVEYINNAIAASGKQLAQSIDVMGYVSALATGDTKAITKAANQLDTSIKNYSTWAGQFNLNLSLSSESLQSLLQQGGIAAVTAAQYMAELAGETLSGSDVETIYRSRVQELINATDQINLSVGSVIDMTTATILNQVEGFQVKSIGGGKAIITATGNLVDAYLKLYNEIEGNAQSTLAEINNAYAKLKNAESKTSMVDALSSASEMSYDTLSTILTDAGIKMKDFFDQVGQKITKDLGGGKIQITDFRSFANILGIDTTTKAYADAFKSYNDAIVSSLKSNINDEIDNISSAKKNDKINISSIYTELINATNGEALLTGLTADLLGIGATLKDGILDLGTADVGQVLKIVKGYVGKIDGKELELEKIDEAINELINTSINNVSNAIGKQTSGYTDITEMSKIADTLNGTIDELFRWDSNLNAYVMSSRGLYTTIYKARQNLELLSKNSPEYQAAAKILESQGRELAEKIDFVGLVGTVGTSEYTQAATDFISAVVNYNTFLSASGKEIRLSTYSLLQAAQAGGKQAIAAAEIIAKQTGKKLTGSDVETLYRTGANKISTAMEQMSLSVGSIIDETTVQLLGISNKVTSLGAGKYVINEAINMVDAYEKLYQAMRNEESITLTELNALQAKMLAEVNGKSQSTIEALSSASDMTYETLAAIGETIGKSLFEMLDMLGDSVEYLGGNHIRITNFDELAKIAGFGDKTSELYIQNLKSYNDAMIEANNNLNKNLTDELKAVSEAKVGDQVNVTYLYSLFGDEIPREYVQALEAYGAELEKGILTLNDESAGNLPKILGILQEAAVASGELTERNLAELQDAVENLIKSITDAIKKGIDGTLSNVEKYDLIEGLKTYGIELEDTDFTKTAEGWQLASDAAFKVVDAMQQIDGMQGNLTLKALRDSLKDAEFGLTDLNSYASSLGYKTKSGNVDLVKHAKNGIPSEKMIQAGWTNEQPGGYSTILTQTYSSDEFGKEIPILLNITPITNDGKEINSPEQLNAYVESLFARGNSAAEILELDKKEKGLLLSAEDVESWEKMPEAIDRAVAEMQQLHEQSANLHDKWKAISEINLMEATSKNDALDFMNNKLPDALENPLTYAENWGKAINILQKGSGDKKGFIDARDWYNIVNEMNHIAGIGQNIKMYGVELDGSLEAASELIQKGYNALESIDGGKLQVNLSQLGVSFEEGAMDMNGSITEGIHAMAQSQIDMLDGLISVLETVVAMQEAFAGMEDITEDGQLDFGELFKFGTDKDGIEGFIATPDFKTAASRLLEMAKSSDDLKKALEQVKINGEDIGTLLQLASDGYALDETRAKALAAAMDAFYKASLSGNYDTDNIYESVKQVLQESGAMNGELSIDIGTTTLYLTGNVITQIDWNSDKIKSALKEAYGNTNKDAQKKAREAMSNWQKKPLEVKGDDLEFILRSNPNVKYQLDKNGKETGKILVDGTEYDDTEAGRREAAKHLILKDNGVKKWDFNLEDGELKGGTIKGKAEEQIIVDLTGDAPKYVYNGYEGSTPEEAISAWLQATDADYADLYDENLKKDYVNDVMVKKGFKTAPTIKVPSGYKQNQQDLKKVQELLSNGGTGKDGAITGKDVKELGIGIEVTTDGELSLEEIKQLAEAAGTSYEPAAMPISVSTEYQGVSDTLIQLLEQGTAKTTLIVDVQDGKKLPGENPEEGPDDGGGDNGGGDNGPKQEEPPETATTNQGSSKGGFLSNIATATRDVITSAQSSMQEFADGIGATFLGNSANLSGLALPFTKTTADDTRATAQALDEFGKTDAVSSPQLGVNLGNLAKSALEVCGIDVGHLQQFYHILEDLPGAANTFINNANWKSVVEIFKLFGGSGGGEGGDGAGTGLNLNINAILDPAMQLILSLIGGKKEIDVNVNTNGEPPEGGGPKGPKNPDEKPPEGGDGGETPHEEENPENKKGETVTLTAPDGTKVEVPKESYVEGNFEASEAYVMGERRRRGRKEEDPDRIPEETPPESNENPGGNHPTPLGYDANGNPIYGEMTPAKTIGGGSGGIGYEEKQASPREPMEETPNSGNGEEKVDELIADEVTTKEFESEGEPDEGTTTPAQEPAEPAAPETPTTPEPQQATEVDTSGFTAAAEALTSLSDTVGGIVDAVSSIGDGMSKISTSAQTFNTAATTIGTNITQAVAPVQQAVQKLGNLQSAIGRIPDKTTIGIEADVGLEVHVSSTKDADAAGQGEKPGPDVSINFGEATVTPDHFVISKAKGTNLAMPQGGSVSTLMGELGPELVVSNGHYTVVGQGGAEFVNLPRDAIVFNHEKTAQLLKNGKTSRGKPLTNSSNAISFAKGSLLGGPAMASAAQALAALKQLRAMWQSLLNASAKDLGSQAGRGGGGGGGDDDDEEKYVQPTTTTADIQRWYNWLRQIDKLEQDITYQEKLQKKYESDRIANGQKIFDTQKERLKLLDQEITRNEKLAELQKSWYDRKREELANSSYGKIFTYDENGLQQYVGSGAPGSGLGLDILENLTRRTVEGEAKDHAATSKAQLQYLASLGFDINDLIYNDDGTKVVKAINARTMALTRMPDDEDTPAEDLYTQLMENFWARVDGWRDELDSLYDSYQDQLAKVIENQTKQNEILQGFVKNELDVEKQLLKAVEAREQAVIDELQQQKDILEKSTNRFIKGVQDALDKQQQAQERNDEQEELSKLQRQLGILQRSGGSATQIKQLQDQIAEKQQNMYYEGRQDEINAVQDAADKQLEKLDQQIELLSDTLEYQKKNGLLWNRVREIMEKGEDEATAFYDEWVIGRSGSSALQQAEDVRKFRESFQEWIGYREYQEETKLKETEKKEIATANAEDEQMLSQMSSKEAEKARKTAEDAASQAKENYLKEHEGEEDAEEKAMEAAKEAYHKSITSSYIGAESNKEGREDFVETYKNWLQNRRIANGEEDYTNQPGFIQNESTFKTAAQEYYLKHRNDEGKSKEQIWNEALQYAQNQLQEKINKGGEEALETQGTFLDKGKEYYIDAKGKWKSKNKAFVKGQTFTFDEAKSQKIGSKTYQLIHISDQPKDKGWVDSSYLSNGENIYNKLFNKANNEGVDNLLDNAEQYMTGTLMRPVNIDGVPLGDLSKSLGQTASLTDNKSYDLNKKTNAIRISDLGGLELKQDTKGNYTIKKLKTIKVSGIGDSVNNIQDLAKETEIKNPSSRIKKLLAALLNSDKSLYNQLIYMSKYATGGMNYTTGPAWLDGTKAKPEAVLNASQTKFLKTDLLGNQKDSLKSIVLALQESMNNTSSGNDANSYNDSVIIENVEVTFESGTISSDYDMKRASEMFKNELVKLARKTGDRSVTRR